MLFHSVEGCVHILVSCVMSMHVFESLPDGCMRLGDDRCQMGVCDVPGFQVNPVLC